MIKANSKGIVIKCDWLGSNTCNQLCSDKDYCDVIKNKQKEVVEFT